MFNSSMPNLSGAVINIMKQAGKYNKDLWYEIWSKSVKWFLTFETTKHKNCGVPPKKLE
jgi:hypothetical protein